MLSRFVNIMGTVLSTMIIGMGLIGCGATDLADSTGDSTGATSATSSEDADVAAAAAASLFSGGANASISALKIPERTLARFVEEAQEEQEGQAEEEQQDDDGRDCGEDDPGCTCADASGEFGDTGPSAVTMGTFGDAGHYGSLEAGLDLAEEDFCTDAEGTDNTGLGPDGIGRFATFTLDGEVTGECVNENDEVTTIVMQSGSAGVFRNTSGDDAHFPEIYGTFDYLINGTDEVTLDCTIFLAEDGGIDFANCSDENGTVVETDDSSECLLNDE